MQLNPGRMLQASTSAFFQWICCFCCNWKSICFPFFWGKSAVLRPDSLSRHTWCEWWQSESLHGACLSWCVGAVSVLLGPQCREVAGHLCLTLCFCLLFNRWNVLFILGVITFPHQLAFTSVLNLHPWRFLLLLCCSPVVSCFAVHRFSVSYRHLWFSSLLYCSG